MSLVVGLSQIYLIRLPIVAHIVCNCNRCSLNSLVSSKFMASRMRCRSVPRKISLDSKLLHAKTPQYTASYNSSFECSPVPSYVSLELCIFHNHGDVASMMLLELLIGREIYLLSTINQTPRNTLPTDRYFRFIIIHRNGTPVLDSGTQYSLPHLRSGHPLAIERGHKRLIECW